MVDEMDLVKQALDAPFPSAETNEEARARLVAHMDSAPRVLTPVKRRPVRLIAFGAGPAHWLPELPWPLP